MPTIPKATSFTSSNVTESGFKAALTDLVNNVASTAAISNSTGIVNNIYNQSQIINGSYVNVFTNEVGFDTGTSAAVIPIRPNTQYKFYAPSYPSGSFGLWCSEVYAPSGKLKRIQYNLRSDGYIEFSIADSLNQSLFLVINVKVYSQGYDVKNSVILEEEENEVIAEASKLLNSIVRDHLLVTNIDKALGIERSAKNLIESAIKLPERYINSSDNIIGGVLKSMLT